MLRHFLPFCTSRRKTPTTFTPWTGKIPPASSTTPPAAPAPVPKDTTPPSPPWAPKPASRPDGPPPVRTEEIRNPGQVPVILTTMTEPNIEKVIVYHKGNFIFTYDLNFRLKQEKRLELAPVAFPALNRYVHHPSIEASFA